MRFVFAVVIFILTPVYCFASDGVLEINQVCAAGDGCFPGDDPGFPVRILNSGSYILTSNLVVPAETDGIASQQADEQVPASLDVSLNLNGFTISSTTTCTAESASLSCSPVNESVGRGIFLEASGGGTFTIRNGTVRGMQSFGVFCRPQCIIENVHAIQNGTAGIWVDGQIHNSNAYLNGGTGIYNNSSAGVTEGCTAFVNKVAGITGSGSFLNNSSSLNYQFGMSFNQATATGNSITGRGFTVDTAVTCINCVMRDNFITGADTGVDFLNTSAIYGGNVISADTDDLQNDSGAIQDGINLCSGSACP